MKNVDIVIVIDVRSFRIEFDSRLKSLRNEIITNLNRRIFEFLLQNVENALKYPNILLRIDLNLTIKSPK